MTIKLTLFKRITSSCAGIKNLILYFGLIFLIITPLQAKTILIIGDSLSAGYGIDEKAGWVNLLKNQLEEKKTDYQVINLSTSGDTSSNGLAKLPQALQRYQPELVIIELGANDGLRGLPTKQLKLNLKSMVQQSQKFKAKVLLLATLIPPNYGPIYLSEYKKVYTDIAKEDQITLIPMFLEGVAGKSEWMQKDGLHPNQKAQVHILSNIWQGLRPLL